MWLQPSRRPILRKLEEQAAAYTPRGFREALRVAGEHGPAIIAELKKASPSRGLIRADFEVSRLAPELERAGAAALSVLTDEEFFQGSLANLQRASASTHLPCLRKRFHGGRVPIARGASPWRGRDFADRRRSSASGVGEVLATRSGAGVWMFCVKRMTAKS